MTKRKHEIEAELARTQRELREARRSYDTVTAALEGGAGNPLAAAIASAEMAECALAALHEAAAAHHRDGNRETWLALHDALAATPADLCAKRDARIRANFARRAIDRAAEIELPGHDGDEESGCCDEDCQRCAFDALLAMLAEAERGAR